MRSFRLTKRWIVAAMAGLLLAITVDLFLPDRQVPWRPLVIDDQAGAFTNLKLSLVRLGPESWCMDLLAKSARLVTEQLPSFDGPGSCGWSNALHITRTGSASLAGAPPHAMRCGLAAGAHIWLGDIDRRAKEHFGTGLARVHHAGTYSCRRMNNQPDTPLSEHAFANAWDVTGFELSTGRIISVRDHWASNGPAGKFLEAARDDACLVFDVILGPEYNAAHHDHFHLDMGGGSSCS